MADGSLLLRGAAEARVHRFTLDDVLAMQALDILQGDRSRELIDGVIFDMASEGELHFDYKIALNRFLVRNVPEHVRVAPDATLMLSDTDAPEPDLFLFEAAARTHPFDIAKLLLVIEIADTSLAHDSNIKAELYARYGVPEYWVVDVNGRKTLVHRAPLSGRYPQLHEVAFGERLAPLRLPDLSFRLADLPR